MTTHELSIDQVLLFLTRFDRTVAILQERRVRPFRFKDEHDVRDTIHSALKPLLADLQCEDPTSKFASKAGRLDLASKALGLALEIKTTLRQGRATKIPSECRERLTAYGDQPWVRHLVFFLYDPTHQLNDPDAIRQDLAKRHSHGSKTFDVYVLGTGLAVPQVPHEPLTRQGMSRSDAEAVFRLKNLLRNRPGNENLRQIDFINTDEALALPPGTTRRLIKPIFGEWYDVDQESEQSIIFKERPLNLPRTPQRFSVDDKL
jgi:hypothetical protein